MSSKNTRAKRLTAACASAAVVTAGGIAFGVTGANATPALSLTTGSSFTALDLGQKVTASQQTLTATTGLSSSDSFTLTYGADTTSTLAKTATPAQVATALNALASVTAAGGVTVAAGVSAGTNDLQTTSNTYVITFKVPGLRTAVSVTVTQSGGTGAASVNSSTAGNTLGGALTANLANATFGTKLTTTPTGQVKLSLDSYTAPSGVTPTGTPGLQYKQQTTGSATGPTSGWAALANAGSTGSVSGNLTAADDVFLTASQPGTYTFHFSDDMNSVGTGDDAVSPTVTVTVLDAYAATTETSDDWQPTVSAAPETSTRGATITASVPFTPITLVDTRSSNSGVGILGSKLAALVGVKFTSTDGTLNTALGANTTPAAVTATATGGTLTLAAGVTTSDGPVASTATFDRNGDGTLTDVAFSSTGTTNVATNGVTGISAAVATAVTGSVATGTNAATIKTGTSSATYSVTVTDAGTKTDDIVTFKLTPFTGTPGLSGTGTLVTDASGVKTYTVAANSDGVASITVTSDKTTAGTKYKVDASSNNQNSTQLVATYADRAASTIEVTSTDAELSPAVGGTAIIKGRLLDQFAAPYVPAGAEPQQVQLWVGTAGGATYTAADLVNASTSGATKTLTLSNGTFQHDYTPATSATAGQTTLFAVGYDTSGDGQIVSAEPRKGSTVSWGSSVAAKTITWTLPVDGTTSVNLSTPSALAIGSGQVFGITGGNDGRVKGQLKDASGNPLPFRNVTLTSHDGVYFSKSATPDKTASPSTGLVSTYETVTDASGYFTAYAVFTRSGNAKIEAWSGGTQASPNAYAATTVTVDDATTPYFITVNSPSGVAGGNLPITGKVTDFFGNPVSGIAVSVSTSSQDAGSLGASTATTNAAGDYNVSFFNSSAVSGETKTDVTVTLPGAASQFELPSPNNWPTWGGPEVHVGRKSAGGKVTVKPLAAETISIKASSTRILGAREVTLSGNTKSDSLVTLYAKTRSGLVELDSVTSDHHGVWTSTGWVDHNTVFLAKLGSSAVSSTVTVRVTSTVKISFKAGRKGALKVTVSGGPSKHGVVTLWYKIGSKTHKASASTGNGSKTWTLHPGKGWKTYKATYQSSGSDVSSTVSKSAKR